MPAKKSGVGSGESVLRRHRAFFVGVFVLVPVVVVPLLILFSVMRSEFWQEGRRLYAVYDENYGFTPRTLVTVYGITVGRVEKVTLAGKNRIVVGFKINSNYVPFVKKDTRAKLMQKNLVVGDWEIALTGGGEAAATAEEGDTLAAEYSLRIDRLTEQVTGMITTVDSVIRMIAAGHGTVGKVLTQDTMANQVQGLLRSVTAMAAQSSRIIRQADTLMANVNKIGTTGVSLADTLDRVMDFVQNSLGDVKAILENVKTLSGNAGPLMDQVQDNLNQAEEMMRGLQQNWLVRKAVGTPNDRMLRDDP
jgi:phospholipid/cholesterol/gamma-HCH transport system substrate-binding protein